MINQIDKDSLSNLSPQELEERIAIFKRLRELLQEQRKKFEEYLLVLEKQEISIAEQDTEKLLAHTELEQQIVQNITGLQKIIKPFESLYIHTYSEKTKEIPLLKADLVKLQKQVLSQNEKNRTALKKHISIIRTKIAGFQNPYKNSRSIYAASNNTAGIINVEL